MENLWVCSEIKIYTRILGIRENYFSMNQVSVGPLHWWHFGSCWRYVWAHGPSHQISWGWDKQLINESNKCLFGGQARWPARDLWLTFLVLIRMCLYKIQNDTLRIIVIETADLIELKDLGCCGFCERFECVSYYCNLWKVFPRK